MAKAKKTTKKVTSKKTIKKATKKHVLHKKVDNKLSLVLIVAALLVFVFAALAMGK